MSALNLPAGIQVFERGWLSANMILSIGKDASALVDSGYCTHSAQTVALVAAALNERPLNLLANTHLHSDHCGGNNALQEKFPALVTLIPSGQAAHVANWDPEALTYSPTGQLCPQFRFTDTIMPGSEIMLGDLRWQIHAAAGHDPHSLIFFEPIARVLISADALWENGFGVVFPELEGEDAFDAVAATLNLIEQLAPKTVIPGHGRVFAYSPQVVERSRQRLEAFVRNPTRHAHHAAKVLLKFKLLEVQRQKFADLSKWALDTPYFEKVRNSFFNAIPANVWIETLAAELVQVGAASREGEYILNG